MPHICSRLALLLMPLLLACGTTKTTARYDAQTVFSVTELTCQGCGDKIIHALKKVPGVVAATFDKAKVTVTVAYHRKRVKLAQLLSAIRKTGFGAKLGAAGGTYRGHVKFPSALDMKWISKGGADVDIRAHLVSGKVTVVDFWAEWCGPCREVDAALKKILQQDKGVAVRKIDVVDWSSKVAKRYLRRAPQLPYVMIYSRTGKLIDQFAGLDIARLKRAIKKGATR